MLNVTDEWLGDQTEIILPVTKDNPFADFVRTEAMHAFTPNQKSRLKFREKPYLIQSNFVERSPQFDFLADGVRGIVPARPYVS